MIGKCEDVDTNTCWAGKLVNWQNHWIPRSLKDYQVDFMWSKHSPDENCWLWAHRRQTSWNQKAVNSQNLALHKKLIKYSAAPPSNHLLKPLPESHLGAHILGAWAADSPFLPTCMKHSTFLYHNLVQVHWLWTPLCRWTVTQCGLITDHFAGHRKHCKSTMFPFKKLKLKINMAIPYH